MKKYFIIGLILLLVSPIIIVGSGWATVKMEGTTTIVRDSRLEGMNDHIVLNYDIEYNNRVKKAEFSSDSFALNKAIDTVSFGTTGEKR